MDDERKICKCRNVSYFNILKSIEKGSKNLQDIIEDTNATTCCGGCISEILSILNSYSKIENVLEED